LHHDLDAFAQRIEGFVTAQYTPGAVTKRLDNLVASAGVQPENHAEIRLQQTQSADYLAAGLRSIAQLGAAKDNFGFERLNHLQEFVGIGGYAYDRNSAIPALELGDQ
jgi:hypothetical protein